MSWFLLYLPIFLVDALTRLKSSNSKVNQQRLICISIPLSNWDGFFKEISITYNLGQNYWDKIENLFFSEKTLLPWNGWCLQSCRLLTTKLGLIQHWYCGLRGRICNLKTSVFFWIYWIFNFYLNKFCPRL